MTSDAPRGSGGNQTEHSLRRLARRIANGKLRTVFLTGAGVSAASGIATYRGDGGVWASFVTDWGTRRRFRQDPLAWYNSFWLASHGQAIWAVQEAAQRQGRTTIRQLVGGGDCSKDSVAATAFPQPNEAHLALEAMVGSAWHTVPSAHTHICGWRLHGYLMGDDECRCL